MRFVFFLIVLILVSCQPDDQTSRTVEMFNTSGDMVGTADISEVPDGVQIELELEGLEAGFHGIHVHENPVCEPPDFTSAGNHLNPEGNEHGLMHPEGSHLGDLPNIEADDKGLVEAELMLTEATMLDGNNSILSGEGSALVIHAGQDDGVSQPGGDAGERIICGEILADPDAEEEADDTPTDPTQFNEDQGEY